MGGAFIGYGMMLLLMLHFGASFLARRAISQELIDSSVIGIWGVINTFTEHNFMQPVSNAWSHKDMQHVSLGVLWWAGGMLGVWLSRGGKRSIVPGIIIVCSSHPASDRAEGDKSMTGFAMSAHAQSLEFSTMVTSSPLLVERTNEREGAQNLRIRINGSGIGPRD